MMAENPVWNLEWNDSIAMQVPEINADHQRFLELIHELNASIIARFEKEEIKARVRTLVDDAVTHFSHEEELFRKWNYPGAERHAQRHAQILESLQEVLVMFDDGLSEFQLIKSGLKVKAALIEHLVKEDIIECESIRTSPVD
ncbi:MAG: hemerythrin domain-containing protein [Gallionella sp.]